MQHPAQSTARQLAYAGLTPFVVPAFLVWVLPETDGHVATMIFRTYAVIILAFLSGMLWFGALETTDNAKLARTLFICAIALSLLAWLALLLPVDYGLPLLLAGFWALRQCELRWLDQRYPMWFIELRDWLTRIVIASHVSVWVFVLQA